MKASMQVNVESGFFSPGNSRGKGDFTNAMLILACWYVLRSGRQPSVRDKFLGTGFETSG